jgi:hypothetical protein
VVAQEGEEMKATGMAKVEVS